MSKVINLPSGASATLRDPSTLRVKDRRKVFEAAGNKEGVLQALSMVDGLIAILVESWSFDLIIPSVRIDSLGELTMPDYDVLAAEANEAQKIIFPQTQNDSDSNPDSPFGNSNA